MLSEFFFGGGGFVYFVDLVVILAKARKAVSRHSRDVFFRFDSVVPLPCLSCSFCLLSHQLFSCISYIIHDVVFLFYCIVVINAALEEECGVVLRFERGGDAQDQE